MSRENTNFWDVLLTIANQNGVSATEICRKLGLSRAYIAKAKTTDTVPLLTTAARLLDACGYELCAVPKKRVSKHMHRIGDSCDQDVS